MSGAIIREFRTARFVVVVDAIEDYSALDDLACSPEAQAELRENLDSGQWILFTARARVLLDGDVIASDYLVGCVYASLADFADHMACGRANREHAKEGHAGRCGSYFADMIATVCAEARRHLLSMQGVYVRGGE